MAAVAQQVRKIIDEVTPGFRVLTNFRWLDRMRDGRGDTYRGNHGCARGEKVAMVVRVVPDHHKHTGLNTLSQFNYRPNIKLATFESLAAALSTLMEEA